VLAEILRRSFPDVTVSATAMLKGDFDFQVSLMSLPSVLATTPETLPNAVPYLFPDEGRVGRWRERLGQDGFKVGIAWQGNPTYPRDRYRSIPLKEFAPLAAIPGVRLISIQAVNGLEQLDHLPRGMRVETFGEAIGNSPDGVNEIAGVMANLDLVITSDTGMAHLAGALGRPIWVALCDRPDWRWLRDSTRSPWYPTMRLFRQTRHKDWAGVFAEVAAALAEVATRGDNGEAPVARPANGGSDASR
jgi:hypothetical protein